jgi:hypothetical protein
MMRAHMMQTMVRMTATQVTVIGDHNGFRRGDHNGFR